MSTVSNLGIMPDYPVGIGAGNMATIEERVSALETQQAYTVQDEMMGRINERFVGLEIRMDVLAAKVDEILAILRSRS